MAYATVEDIQGRILRDLTEDEQTVCTNLLDDAAVLIDSYNTDASADAKKVVSCNVVIRAIGDGQSSVPVGATQGSVSAMGYTESWTITGGAAYSLYLNKTEKRLLGVSNKIVSHSSVEELVIKEEP